MEKIRIVKKTNYIMKGLLISFLFTFIALLILSIILTYTSVSESIENAAIIIINSIAILLGSSIATKNEKSKGIIKGGLCGLIYIFIIYLLSSIVSMKFSLNINSIITIISSIVAGMFGGIIGVNLNGQ